MRESIIESVKSLPPLSKTINEINRIYNDQEAGVIEMAKVIEEDPMVVANLLKAANSPLYGFAKEIKNVTQAVSLFGLSTTRSIAIGNAIRKLLNVDMEPYGITSSKYAEISSLQATLAQKWFLKLSKEKAEKIHLMAFLQETGKIIIASEIIKEDETIQFQSEIEMTNSIAQVEKSYVDTTTSVVSALIFKHWKFDNEFVNIIKYADYPTQAPEEFAEYSQALHIIKTIIPVNKPLTEQSIILGLQKADKFGFNHELLEDSVDEILEVL
ncbi:MAG: HDOD domain-containing protein [Epsilonproteobacteria bacterium]|nr:HDOD domain-containing protein [Campylobacterota bacterium]